MSKKAPSGKELIATRPTAPVERSKQYQNVTAKIDSGATIDKFYAKHSAATLNSHNVRNVTAGFKRIRLTTLARWLETAMIVLSEPDYVETNENIYDLAGEPPPAERAVSEATSQLSMAGTEAVVCMEEPGVPPMYMYGPDIVDQEEAVQKVRQVQYRVEEVGPDEHARRQQVRELHAQTQALTRQFAQQNRSSGFALGDAQAVQAPSSLDYVQSLTTRQRHQKLVSRIQLLPGLQLQVYKDQPAAAGARALAFPCRTKQFVVVDMRPDADAFAARHFWGSVHLPLALLHRAGARMPGPLHYFAKFEESIFVVVGLLGAELERALHELVDYGIAQRNVVPLMQSVEEASAEYPTLFVSSE